jgi:uncharacterized protein (DUF362 family)
MGKSQSSSPINRRDFLRRAAALVGTATLAAALEACVPSLAEPTALPSSTGEPGLFAATREPVTPTDMPAGQKRPTSTSPVTSAVPSVTPTEGIARVAFVKTEDRADGVRRAIDLLGIEPFTGQRVFLKPNFNSADPAPGSTHPEVLAALVTIRKTMGAEKITVGDRSGMGNTRIVLERIGVFQMAKELGYETIVLDELEEEDWTIVEPPGSHWSQGFPFARPCLEADALVQTCCLKTHRYGGHFTLSLKNSVGMVAKRIPQVNHNFMDELHSSPHQRRMIAEINAAYTPTLVVLDGVEAFISGGPDAGERVDSQVILAGTDRVAIDAAGVALLRYHGCQTEAARGKIFEQEQIARAVELGIGIDSPEKVEFLTDDADSLAYSQSIKDILLAG